MTKKILVAIDGSDHGELTLQRAAKIAAQDKAQLVILHAVVPHALNNEEIAYAEERCAPEFRNRLVNADFPELPVKDAHVDRPYSHYVVAHDIFFRVRGEDILKRATSAAEKLGVTSVRSLLEFERPSKAILDAARREDVDMIVLGRSGQNRLIEFFLGGTAQKVLQHANRTIMLIAESSKKK